jgi:hypothetical protein
VTDQLSLFEGRRLRDEGVALVETADADAAWRAWADGAIRWLATTRPTFSANDLAALQVDYGIAPPSHPNSVGAAFLRAARLGLIEKTGGIEQMRTAAAHARNVIVWRGA